MVRKSIKLFANTLSLRYLVGYVLSRFTSYPNSLLPVADDCKSGTVSFIISISLLPTRGIKNKLNVY